MYVKLFICMRKFFFLMSMLFMVGACGTDPLCTTPEAYVAGLGICSEGPYVPEHIEYIVDRTEYRANQVYPEVIDLRAKLAQKHVTVSFLDDALSVGCEEVDNGIYRCDSHIGGATTRSGKTIYVRYYECMAWTSLAHELLHSIQYYYLGGTEGEDGHATPEMFIKDAENQGLDWRQTIEGKIKTDSYYETNFHPTCQR